MPARAVTALGAKLPNLVPRADGVFMLQAFSRAEREALEAGVSRIMVEDVRLGRGAGELTRVRAELLDAHRALCALRTCPLCGKDADGRFKPRDGATFRCKCPCGSEWGIRICGHCHQRFPVLSSGTRRAAVTTGDDLDQVFGNEVLAVPCPGLSQGDAGQQFRCPWCAYCPHHRADPCSQAAGPYPVRADTPATAPAASPSANPGRSPGAPPGTHPPPERPDPHP